MSMANRGLKCVASTGMTAPRISDTNSKCTLPHALLFNVGIAFWWFRVRRV